MPFILLTSAATTAALAALAWSRRTAPGALLFAVAMGLVAIWDAAAFFGAIDPSRKLFWASVEYVPVSFLPVAWLTAVFHYTGRGRCLKPHVLSLVCLIPLAMVALTWTSEFHGLIRRDAFPDAGVGFQVAGQTYGPWSRLAAAYGQGLFLASIYLLLGAALAAPAIHRGQPVVLLVSVLIPALGSISYTSGILPVRRFDPTPGLATIGGLVAAWGFLRYHLFDVVPVARDRLFDALRSGIIVLDSQSQVLDMNRAAREVLGIDSRPAVGRRAGEAFAGWPQLAAIAGDANKASGSLSVGDGDSQRHYEVRASLLGSQQARPGGRMITIRDATERSRAQATLLQRQRTLAILETRARLERDVADVLNSRVQGKLLEAWRQLGECGAMLDSDWPGAKKLMAEVREMIDDVREREIRQASHRLHPLTISLGLVPAVRLLVAEFEEHFSISLNIDPQLMQLDGRLENHIPNTVRLAAYRIIEGALENAHHHARASALNIDLAIDAKGRLTIRVQDDGCGFDIERVDRGLGLDSIAGRIDRLGGEWKIESKVGEGTDIAAVLPLDQADPHGR